MQKKPREKRCKKKTPKKPAKKTPPKKHAKKHAKKDAKKKHKKETQIIDNGGLQSKLIPTFLLNGNFQFLKYPNYSKYQQCNKIMQKNT